MIAIVDAGALYASLDVDDRHHSRCTAVLSRTDLELVVPALAVAEVLYFLEQRHGPEAEAKFLRGLSTVEVEAPFPEDWPAMADMVEQYRDFPLGGADASVAVLAERLGTDVVVTVDRRHFGAIRMSDGRPFRILPE